ncbi:MAG TPA: Gfo/Idh/MocA family oxidoreductase [Candidatus Methylacidiphilales bacterium]|jgi:predicted dehydrogenase|nr:Gfo/Idh/MocA family oxidoreductase [Candidatus Methylacidiphilales bacterium]
MSTVRIGIIGGGLMGREVASALARWFVLDSFPVRAELTAVCDLVEKQRDWFRQIPTVNLVTADHRELLASPDVDVVYVAVPHHLHEALYFDVLNAGKDLLAEKPFGIDLKAARNIAAAAKASGRFVRCSSEFPFLPGAQRAVQVARAGGLGKLLEVRSGFHHSSDLDPTKPANWKRQVKTCGAIGVMGDLGMHTVHVPFRLGWKPKRVYAQLQKIYLERPDGKGGTAVCDTWDNALLHTDVDIDGAEVPVRFEMKRLAPGETNSWFIEILGTDGGVKFSTKEPKTLWTFQRGKEQQWQRTDLGFHGPFPTITGGIFEPGFPDCFLQMWAAFLAERAGKLDGRFGCVTPDEAVASHELFAAALVSHTEKRAIAL